MLSAFPRRALSLSEPSEPSTLEPTVTPRSARNDRPKASLPVNKPSKPPVSNPAGSQLPAHLASSTCHPTHSKPSTNEAFAPQPSTGSGKSIQEHSSVESGNSPITALQRGPYEYVDARAGSSARPLHVPNTPFASRPSSTPTSRAGARNEFTNLAADASQRTPLSAPPPRFSKQITSPAVVVAGLSTVGVSQTAASRGEFRLPNLQSCLLKRASPWLAALRVSSARG